MRAITPILAITVLVAVTIAAGGFVFFTMTTYQSQTEKAGSQGLETSQTVMNTKVDIESVSKGKIYLRNKGTTDFPSPQFFVDGYPMEVTGPEVCVAKELCVYVFNDTIDCEADCELSLGADVPLANWVGDSSKLQPCGDGTCESFESTETCPEDCPPPCGNDVCAGDEDCINCPEDCPTCDFQLRLENSTEYNPAGSNEGFYGLTASNFSSSSMKILLASQRDQQGRMDVMNYSSSTLEFENNTNWYDPWQYESNVLGMRVADVDDDGALEIVHAGFRKESPHYADLFVWNYTDGLLYENSTNWYGSESGETHAWDLYIIDMDADGTLEILTTGYTYADSYPTAELRVWNYTDGRLETENSTEWKVPNSLETKSHAVRAANLDADPQLEAVTAGYTIVPGPVYAGQLSVFNYTDGLSMETHTEWNRPETGKAYTFAAALDLSDVDDDGTLEMLVLDLSTSNLADFDLTLSVWNYTGGEFAQEASTYFPAFYTEGAIPRVWAYDLESDGVVEILTLDTYPSTPTLSRLQVWNITDGALALEASQTWGEPFNDTVQSSNLYIGNIDADARPEIVTISHIYDPSITYTYNAQMRIWNYTSPPA